MALAIVLQSADLIFGAVERYELADKQIELAVVVVIKPYGARSPAWRCNTSLLRDVGESAIGIIVIENAAPVLGHVKIREAIAIVVADRYALAVATSGNTGLLGDVGKSPVAIVPVQ